MPGPNTPVISTFPLPPPVGNLPFGQVRENGQVYWTPGGWNFIQILWASIQGQGGLIDLLLSVEPSPGQISAAVESLLAQQVVGQAVEGAMNGRLAALSAEINEAILYALSLPPRQAAQGPQTDAYLIASENIAANAMVNLFDGGAGVFRVRNADDTLFTDAKFVDGFAPNPIAIGTAGIVRFSGIVGGQTGLTPGDVWLGAAGAVTSTPPSTSGMTQQRAGIAVNANQFNFAPYPPFGV